MTKVDVFSGFLGAGKTTLIKKLLRDAYAGQQVVLNYRSDRYRRGGDHLPFQQLGFTAVRVCEWKSLKFRI